MGNKIKYFLYTFYILEGKQTIILSFDNGNAGIFPPWKDGDFVNQIKNKINFYVDLGEKYFFHDEYIKSKI